MTSLDMFTDRPRSMAARRRGLPVGSPPPARAATPISRITLVKILPRWASVAFLRASIDGPRPMVLLLRRIEEVGILPCADGVASICGVLAGSAVGLRSLR